MQRKSDGRARARARARAGAWFKLPIEAIAVGGRDASDRVGRTEHGGRRAHFCRTELRHPRGSTRLTD